MMSRIEDEWPSCLWTALRRSSRAETSVCPLIKMYLLEGMELIG